MDIEDEEDRKLALKIVNKMLRKTVVGSHKKQVDTVKGWGSDPRRETRRGVDP